MLKDSLLSILKDIKSREQRKESLMKESVGLKLDRSLEFYESNLQDTCKYILSKNPITTIKGINKEFKSKENSEEI